MRGWWCVWLILWGSAGWAESNSPQTYRIETVAGSADLGDGGAALAAEFGDIQALALDPFGNLYLSDTDHHRVRKVSADGVITTVAGTGVAGFSGDGGPGTRAQLNLPYGLAAGPAGEVYVADLGNQRVRRIAPDGFISTVAGNGTRGPTGDFGPATGASLCAPRNLLLDAAGNLYIAEFEGHRVRKVAPDGTISRVAGTGQAGFSGDGGAAYMAQVAFPSGLAMDRWGALYVADSQNQRIRRITPDGLIRTVVGETDGVSLLTPTGVAVDRDGAIYVADRSASLRSYTSWGAWTTIAGSGTPAFTGDGGPAASASLTSANDILLSGEGDLYLADGMRIRRIDRTGIIHTVAGDGYLRFVGDGGRAMVARLSRPSSVALDAAGNLYVADPGTQRVRRVTVSGSIENLTGDGLPGLTGEDVPASGAPIGLPMGVAVDTEGNLIIAETGSHRIRRVSGNDRITTLAGTGAAGTGMEGGLATQTPLRKPRGVCTGPKGMLYVVDTDNHRVLAVGADQRVALIAGNGTPGGGGDEGPARGAQLNQPAACALDADGNLLIADTRNHRIRRVTPGGAISSVAGTGTAGSSGDEGPAAAARLSSPGGVAVDGAGSIFISDTTNHRIRQVTPDGIIHTIAGGDTGGYRGDGGPALAALLDAPGGMQLDASGNLYFADTNNNRVRRLIPQTELPPAPVIQLSAVNAANLLAGPVAPGESLTIFGDGLGPDEGMAGALDSLSRLATEAGGTEVGFDGVPAPVFYAQSAQVNVQVPYTVAGRGVTQVEIRYQGETMGRMTLAVAESAPALFPVAANQDGSPNSSAEPAPRGTIVTVYGTGEGLTDGANESGQAAQFPYPRPNLPVSLTVAGVPAEILYAGSAPGLVGVFQVNARMPGGYLPAGPAPMILTIGSAHSPVFEIWLR